LEDIDRVNQRQISQATNIDNNPLFDQNLELATEGLEPYFLEHLKTKLSQENALTISKYILSMRSETNISDNHRRGTLTSLKLLSIFLNNISFKKMSREDILSYVDSIRKSEQDDPSHCWVATYNHSPPGLVFGHIFSGGTIPFTLSLQLAGGLVEILPVRIMSFSSWVNEGSSQLTGPL
jgi:hypothetical protein